MTAGDGSRDSVRGRCSDAAIGEPPDCRRYAFLAVGDRRLAVGIEYVERVTYAVELMEGDLPPPLIGLVNLHGEMIPAIDLRSRLGIEPRDVRLSDRLVLLRRGALRCFAIADAVEGMAAIPDSIAREAGRGGVDCCSAEVALEDGPVAFLDLSRLLDAAEGAGEGSDRCDDSQPSDDGDRELVRRVLRARAAALARPLAGEQSESTVDLVTLHIDGFHYAIEATLVREVYAVREVTPLPTAPEFVLGITNIRGKIIAVLDLAVVLGQNGADRASGRIIVVEIGGIEVGIDARECGVARVPNHRLQPPSRGARGRQERDRYLKLIGGEDLGVLDVERIIADTRRTAAPLGASAER